VGARGTTGRVPEYSFFFVVCFTFDFTSAPVWTGAGAGGGRQLSSRAAAGSVRSFRHFSLVFFLYGEQS
jgi:hypothetical protein